MNHVLVYGGSGALGRKVVQVFKSKGWKTLSVDYRLCEFADKNVVLSFDQSSKHVVENIRSAIEETGSIHKLSAIINVAGGWAGGNVSDDGFIDKLELMYSQSVVSSAIAARIAHLYLKEGGLLCLTGASAALEETPGMIAYGLMKAAVHHLTKSLAANGGGLPTNAKVVSILPVILDTPGNKAAMPKADTSTWTPLETVANQLFEWSSDPKNVTNGALVKIKTANNKTEFV